MAKKILIPVVAGVAALSLVGGFGVAKAFATNDVTLVVDGVSKTISVRQDTVAQVLDLEGLAVGEHDVVMPSLDTKVSQDMEINVAFGRPLTLTVDGVTKTVWTTAQSVCQALAFLNLDAADSKYSTSRSTGIGREGLTLSIATAKDVTLTVAGQPSQLTIAGTVGDALAKLGVTPDADDKVTPGVEVALSDGLQITYVNVEQKTRTEVVSVDFGKSEVKSDSMYSGDKKVTTKGVAGQNTESWTDTYEDGVLVNSVKTDTVVDQAPVDQVTTVGTKKRPSSNLSPASGSTCKASYYWQGQMTANGERFNPSDFTAAHKTLPFGTRVKVTNLSNSQTTVVRINDRGPYIAGRCLDLSKAAMQAIGGTSAGVITVAYEVVG